MDANSSYPRDLRECTQAQHQAAVVELSKLTIAQLRVQQDVIRQQIGMAFKQKHTMELANLQIMEEWRRIAVELKAFAPRIDRGVSL